MTKATSLSDTTALRDEVVPRHVRQFGSARDGLREWRLQRLTAIAVIPLSRPGADGLPEQAMVKAVMVANAVSLSDERMGLLRRRMRWCPGALQRWCQCRLEKKSAT